MREDRMSPDNDMSIVVVSCDKYLDIAQFFLYYLGINWPNCKYRIFIAEEECNLNSDIAEIVLCGKNTSWTRGAIEAISRTKSQYILLTNDDYYIYEKVNNSEIDEVIKFIKENDIKYYRIPAFKQKNRKYAQYKNNKNVEMIPKNKAYAVSIGTSIWKRDEILKILGDGTKTAWDIENDFSRQSADSIDEYYINYVSDRRNLLHYVHMATWGKWIPWSAKVLIKHGYNDINYSKRGFISKRECIKIKLYEFATRIVPTKMRKNIKRVLSMVGFKFATSW